ncbi:sulfotransferase domain-containing protein [Geodermatophilus sp. SYSU D01176]
MAPDMPTFIVIGAMKAGTTSLYHYLRSHDEIYMPKVKELDYFAAEANWSRGLDWYRQQFAGANGALARGEASTLYTKYPQYQGVPERIAAVVPDARLVYVVRDPVVRMRSHYQHRVALGAETAPPEVALLENPIYLAYSQYAMQLERYFDHFPREQVLVVTSEGLRHDRAAVVRRVYEFLGVDPTQLPPALDSEFYRTAQRRSYPPAVWAARRFLKHHVPQAKRAKEWVDSLTARRGSGGAETGRASSSASGGRLAESVLPPELREQLADLLADDVARLRTYMGPDFDGWGLA